MRAVWATHLDIELADVPRARAAVRHHVCTRYGIDPDGAPGAGGVDVAVAVTDSSGPDGDRVRSTVVSVEHPDDVTVQIRDDVAVGTSNGRGFLWIRRSLVPITHIITGTVAFTPVAPDVAVDICAVANTTDGSWPVTPKPEPFDRATLEAQLYDPARRLPVIGLSDGCGVDPATLARSTAGVAHVVDLGRRVAELPAAFGVGVGGGAVLWWPGWPGARVQRWSGDELVDRFGAGAPIIRLVANASAFRVGEPDVLSRIAAASSRAHMEEVRSTPRADVDLDEVLTHWERDLALLEGAVEDAAAARAEAEQLREENLALLAAWDDTTAAAAAVDDDRGNSDGSYGTVAEVLRWADRHLEHLDVSPEAHRSASDSPYRWPNRLADALTTINDLAAQWSAGELHGGFVVAAPAAGLPWRNGVSDTAHAQYPDDYAATTVDGDRVLCGPHLRFGAQTGPEGHLRCYMWLDRERRRVLIGPTGRHGRDRSNR